MILRIFLTERVMETLFFDVDFPLSDYDEIYIKEPHGFMTMALLHLNDNGDCICFNAKNLDLKRPVILRKSQIKLIIAKSDEK